MSDLASSHQVSLVVSKFGCDPGVISQVLGIEPTESWKAGDRRRPGGGLMPWSHWDVTLPERSGDRFAQSIQEFLSRLGHLRDRLLELSTSARIEISLILFTVDSSSRITIPTDLSRFATESGARVRCYVYYIGNGSDEVDAPRQYIESDNIARDFPEGFADDDAV